jgi:hypothetical protein
MKLTQYVIITVGVLVSNSILNAFSLIYVETTGFGAPYYNFYADSEKDQQLDLYSGGTDSLLVGVTYTFIRDGGTAHPFYISDLGWNTTSSSKITLIGDGSATSGITDSESFTLEFTGFDPQTDTLTYYCSAHSSMQGTLNVIPEPASVALATGLMVSILIIVRRPLRNSRIAPRV